MLQASAKPLTAAYDLAMFDLDGVVYVSGHAVAGAARAIAGARESGLRVAFVTNNAARSPEAVAANLQRLGIDATAADVVTAAQAAARLLSDRLPRGARVHVLGGSGLEQAVSSAGLTPVHDFDGTEAIVSGYGPDVLWRDVMRAAVQIRDGLWWVASNTDLTIPTDFGLAPGHGVQVRMLEEFADVSPVVAGKPARPLLEETIRRVGGDRPLMVGDRLDTDIEGAHVVGVDSLLVLTGVTGLADLVAADTRQRPTYLSVDLAGLGLPHPAVHVGEDGGAVCGGWQVAPRNGRPEVSGRGSRDDWWRAVAVAAWTHLDRTGAVVDTSGLTPP